MNTRPDSAASDKGPLLLLSARFSDWLASVDAALSLTTYQAGRLFFIGRKADGGVRAHERMIEQCQGLWTDGQTLWTSGRYMLWRFENVLRNGAVTPTGADRKFVPVEGRVIGGIDTHDIGVGDVDGARQRPIFVNTLYCCLATISETASFRPLWRPSFLSALVPEDRCHLNGLAMDGARPAFVSAVSRSDVADGWRDRRHDGGIVIDVASNEIVASGFSMPHSPRLYDGKLWLLNSGAGEFGGRSGGWYVHTGVLLSRICTGSRLHRPLRRHRIVAAAPRPHLCRAGARRPSVGKRCCRTLWHADRRHRQRERGGMGALRAHDR